MKGIYCIFSAILFFWLIALQGHSSQNFSVSVSFGGDEIEAVVCEATDAEAVSVDTGIEYVVFGMPYCMSSDQYSVEAVYTTGTELIDIPEPTGCIGIGSIVFLVYKKLTESAYAKEKADE